MISTTENRPRKVNLRRGVLIVEQSLLPTLQARRCRPGEEGRSYLIRCSQEWDFARGLRAKSFPVLYQDTLILVKELYRIMNGQDKDVLFRELIPGP